MKNFIDNSVIGTKRDIFNRMKPENLQACQNSLDTAVPSPEEIIIMIENDRESLEDTLSN